MKNIKYIVLLLASFVVVSCNLDQDPGSHTPGNEIKDAEGVNNLIVACYASLHQAMEYEWSMTELRSDNARLYSSGSSSTTTKIISTIDKNTLGSDNPFMDKYWIGSHVVIDRCNFALEHMHFVENPDLKAQYSGEARFLRANSYFNLVRLWGGVFLVTKTLSKEEARVKERSSTKEMYDFIEEELESIISIGNPLLPLSYPSKETGRVTLTAAKVLLAKVYMTQYDVDHVLYGRARVLLEEVLAEVGNPMASADLVAYSDIFDIHKEMNKEIIFAVRYSAVNKGIGSPFGNFFAPTNNGGSVIIGSANSYNYPTDNIIKAFKQEGTDLRMDVTLEENYKNDQGVVITKVPSRSVKKFRSAVTYDYDGENDWPVIRVGDVILLYAEVLNEIEGPSAMALQYLNMTRGRAGLPALTNAELPDRVAFSKALKTERRLELAFENHRLFDLMRWNEAVIVMNDLYINSESFYNDDKNTTNEIEKWQTLLPIPLSIININPDIPQNFGY